MVTPLLPEDPVEIDGYVLVDRLGSGGMGIVYRAYNYAGFQVAVKVIKEDLLSNPEIRARFRREMAAAQRVPRFCTAPFIDGQAERDPPYYVSEYVEGMNLAQKADLHGPKTGSELEYLAVAIMAALTAIHGSGVAHRDLKPSNVLLGPHGPRVIDFGLAVLAENNDQLSKSGQIIGTPAYMEAYSAILIGGASPQLNHGLTRSAWSS